MKDKTKKIVAGVVLGTFVFGATTPAFAEISLENTITTTNQSSITNNTSESEIIVINSTERGKITITLKALKKLILDNKDTIKNVLVGLNIVQEKGFDSFYDKFMKVLDLVFDTNDTIEDVFTDALVNLGLNESLA
ncbi:MAG: hypothetical protein ACI3U1_06455, partial [Peptococcaceae bacterium]